MPSSAINEPALYITEIKATDRAYAQRLRGKLDELRAFNTQLSNIRASFCSENGFTYSGVRKVLSDETRDKAQVKFEWGYVRNILQTPFTELQEGQLGHAAQFFVGLNTTAEIERFINAMAVPVANINSNIGSFPLGSTGSHFPIGAQIAGTNSINSIPFVICPNMVGGIQSLVRSEIIDATVAQMNLHPESRGFQTLDANRHNMMQQYAILATISNMTSVPGTATHTVRSAGRDSYSGSGYRPINVLVGGPSGPFSLRESDVNVHSPLHMREARAYDFTLGVVLSFTEGVVRDVQGRDPHIRLEPLAEGVSNFVTSEKHISALLQGDYLAGAISHSATLSHYSLNQFDLRQEIILSLMADTLPFGAGATVSVIGARENAARAQQNVLNEHDQRLLGELFASLGFEAIVITNVTGTASSHRYDFNVHAFPSAATQAGITSFVTAAYDLPRARQPDSWPVSSQPDFWPTIRPDGWPTTEQFMSNFGSHFEWYVSQDEIHQRSMRNQAESSVNTQRDSNPMPSGLDNTPPSAPNQRPEESFN